jgi:hypothetical protein
MTMFTNRHARRRGVIWILMMIAVAALSVAGSTSAFAMGTDGGSTTNPWIQSDQADYAPGSTVTLNGGNWAPGESVHIFVDDTNGHTWSHSADVTADDSGLIQDVFSLPNTFISDYDVTATGTQSGVATTTFMDGPASDGDGMMTVSPTTVANGATGQTLTFTFTAQNGKDFNPGSAVTITVPAGWSAPKTTGGGAGVVTATAGTCSPGSPTASGGVITVPMACTGAKSFTVTYANATAPSPTSATLYTFTTMTKVSGGTLTPIGASPGSSQPTVSVAAPTDTTPPDTSILTSPTNPSNSSSASFTFSSTEAGSSFECKLDAAAFGSCTSPKSYSALADGSHTFQVRATDAAGNTDATPASSTWTVDTVNPVSKASAPAAANGSFQVTYTDSDPAPASGVAKVELLVQGPTDLTPQVVATDSGGGIDQAFSYSPNEGEGIYQVFTRATDAAGNSEAAPTTPDAVVSVNFDTTKPTSVASSPQYHNSTGAFLVGYTASDPGATASGLASVDLYAKTPGGSFVKVQTDSAPTASGSFSYTPVAGDGDYAFYTVAHDQAGNDEAAPSSADTVTTQDTVNPVTTDNADSNWHNSTVTVTLSPGDPGGINASGVAATKFRIDGGTVQTGTSVSIPAPSDHSNDGLRTITYYSVDKAGNVESNRTATVKIDTRAPSDVCGSAPIGWNASNVTINCTASDDASGSGVVSGDQSFSLSTSVAAGAENSSASTNSYTVHDTAGNTTTAGPISGIKVDRKSPTVTCPTAVFQLGQSPATVTATVSDGGSGPLTATVSAAADTTTVTSTPRSVSLTGKDNVGNQTTVTCSYSVAYKWSGFFQPIDNNPDQSGDASLATVWNSAKAGQAIPIKFSLSGYQGMSIFWDASYPKTTKVTCPASIPSLDAIETYASSTAGLQYDPTSDQYNYPWKTSNSLAGSCQMLTVRLTDGTNHYAFFKFTK